MHNLARRAGRIAIVPVLAGTAVFGLTAPAVAAPSPAPAADEKDCSEPLDGVTACRITVRHEDGSASLRASVSIEEGRTLKRAVVALEACDGVACNPVATAAGRDTDEVTTDLHEWGRGTGYYRVNASWVDDRSNAHSGIVHPDW